MTATRTAWQALNENDAGWDIIVVAAALPARVFCAKRLAVV